MSDSTGPRINTPALWCEPCQMWWPGAILVGFPDDTAAGGIRDPTPEEELEHAKYCPECGTRLDPAWRPYYRSEDGHR